MSGRLRSVASRVRRAVRGAPFVIMMACVPPEGEGPRVDTGVIEPVTRADTAATLDSLTLAELVHANQPRAAVGDAGWEYVRESTVDLDGDGAPERLVVLAQVEMRGSEPVWDDSQNWNVYVESAGARRTYLLVRYVQLGHVEAVVAPSGPGGARPIGVIVRSPTSLSMYEVRYRGPDSVSVRRTGHQEIDPGVSPSMAGRSSAPGRR